MMTVIKTNQFGVSHGKYNRFYKSKESLMGIGLFLYSGGLHKPLKYRPTTDIIEQEARYIYDPDSGGG
jgi:hypothetical protein